MYHLSIKTNFRKKHVFTAIFPHYGPPIKISLNSGPGNTNLGNDALMFPLTSNSISLLFFVCLNSFLLSNSVLKVLENANWKENTIRGIFIKKEVNLLRCSDMTACQ